MVAGCSNTVASIAFSRYPRLIIEVTDLKASLKKTDDTRVDLSFINKALAHSIRK